MECNAVLAKSLTGGRFLKGGTLRANGRAKGRAKGRDKKKSPCARPSARICEYACQTHTAHAVQSWQNSSCSEAQALYSQLWTLRLQDIGHTVCTDDVGLALKLLKVSSSLVPVDTESQGHRAITDPASCCRYFVKSLLCQGCVMIDSGFRAKTLEAFCLVKVLDRLTDRQTDRWQKVRDR